jgi:hypothetical protein
VSPKDVVREYVERVWNGGDIDALTEFTSDPYTRHDAGGAVVMTHDDQLERVTRERAWCKAADGTSLRFSPIILTGDGTDVCWVWNMNAPLDCELADKGLPLEVVDGEIHMCGLEIFRVVDGLITDVWNPPTMAGHWG